MPLHNYSTGELADKVGVTNITILRWHKKGLLGKVKVITLPGGLPSYFWTAAHVQRALKLKGRQKPGPKPKARRPA
ncbi:MAG: MerR family transcriptional regulator [Burkholderiales bacterium]